MQREMFVEYRCAPVKRDTLFIETLPFQLRSDRYNIIPPSIAKTGPETASKYIEGRTDIVISVSYILKTLPHAVHLIPQRFPVRRYPT